MRLTDYSTDFEFLNQKVIIGSESQELISLLTFDIIITRLVFEPFLDEQQNRIRFNIYFQDLFAKEEKRSLNKEDIYIRFYAGLHTWHLQNQDQLSPLLGKYNLNNPAELKLKLSIIADHFRATPPAFREYLKGKQLLPSQLKVAEKALMGTMRYFTESRNEKEVNIVDVLLTRVVEIRIQLYNEK